MVRAGNNGMYMDIFKEYNLVAIGWDLGNLSHKSRDEIKQLVSKTYSNDSKQTRDSYSSQIIKFVFDFQVGDYVISYYPLDKKYIIGKISSDYYYSHFLEEEIGDDAYSNFRKVEWLGEFFKDSLNDDTKRSLNAMMTIFSINEYAQKDILEEFDNPREPKSDGPEGTGIGDEDVKTVHYWLYAPGEGAYKWDEFYDEGIMAIGWNETGNLKEYPKKNQIRSKLQEVYNDNSSHKNDVHALWQFANEIQIGDIVFSKKGMGELIGVGIVESDYEFDTNYDYFHVRKVNWIKKGNWPFDGKLAMKTLTDVTVYTEFVKKIKETIEGIVEPPEPPIPSYSSEDFLEEVYIDENDYNTLVNLVKNKKNLIVEGAPGVGKTFMAKRLAYSIMGVKDTRRVMMVQFHQSYSYEDFVMGYRPSKGGFELREGSFYNFCKNAEEDSENDYFFIIDEINRGNLSKIFGELFMLIENDKRGEKNKIQLLYSDELFFIPKNVYIIGLMNTADRSLAMIDYALRRRFVFFDLKPGFDSYGFIDYKNEVNNDKFNELVEVMKELNQDIKEDESLGEGFRIGHSYLCNIKAGDVEEKLNYIVEYELIPLLKEYWFDEQDKIDYWSDRLRSVIDDSAQDNLY